jgi:glucosamine--fructose-6-phosphate aminotransferase (isomerizing)
MCGIIGYVGDRQASDVIIEGLKHLEYRGYDSAGIAVNNRGRITVAKKEGRIANLEALLKEKPLYGNLAIGHTRWATHGKPSDVNAHPFVGSKRKYAVVHNGIIENYLEIKDELVSQGVVFHSKTDSEVIVHLLESFDNGDPVATILKTIEKLKGSFAIGIIYYQAPDTIFAAKKDNPLIVGCANGEGFICSDVNSLPPSLNKVVVLDNEQFAIVKKNSIDLFNFKGEPLEKQFTELSPEEWGALEGFDCYMDKEISEIPVALRRAITYYRENKSFEKIDNAYLKRIKRINIVGCGTALHAGLCGEKLIKKYLPDVDVYSDMASEFRYNPVKVDDKTLTITISQSGETADTLICQKMVDEMGGKTLTICNVPSSSMVHYADFNLQICAGKEVAVASTKAYNCQVLIFTMFILDLAHLRGTLSDADYDYFQKEIDKLPEQAKIATSEREDVKNFAEQTFRKKCVFYLGRGLDYCVAMEGSLKLKEISYIHCEAYAAGELKHGTLALIEKDVVVVALITDRDMVDKMYSSLAEVRTRGAKILTITPFSDEMKLREISDYLIEVPTVDKNLSPIVSVIPTQLISYYIARAKGCDIDKPRNLAKSVTVE